MKIFKTFSWFFILIPLYALSEENNSADHPLQMPLDMPVNVEPNIIVTIDNSGSMDTDRTPDGLSGYEFCVRSHICNVSFFNPEYDYKLPYKYTYDEKGLDLKLYENPYPKKFDNGYLETYPSAINDNELYYYKLDVNKVVGSKVCKDKPYNESQCFEKRNVRTDYGEDGVKRYAIWYSFYRTRMLAVQSSANIAFSALPSNIRFIWQDMESCFLPTRGKQYPNATASCVARGKTYNRSNYFEKFSGEHKYNFFNWLANLNAPGMTPLHRVIREAGEYVSTKEAYIDIPEELQRRGKTPENIKTMSYTDIRKFLYDEDVVAKYGEPKIHTCRANYHILLTDGGWNDYGSVGNYDGSNIQLGTLDGRGDNGIPYSNRSPYGDSHYTTLADTAFYYWARKLVDLPSDLVPYYEEGGDFWNPKNNPATWQHMSNFMVAFGLSSTLVTDTNNNPNNYPVWDETKDRPTFENLDGKVWPSTGSTQGKIYDLWHAAINTRGEFFSVDRPDDLIIAFNRIIQRVGERQTYGTSPAISSGVVESQDLSKAYSVSYQATFDSEEGWTGNVKATKTDEKGSSSALWAAGAKELLERSLSSEKDIDRRVVKTSITAGSGLNIKHKMIDFTWSEISDDYKYLLNINPDTNKDDKLGESRLRFIRGSNQLADGEIFRRREYKLGDIINSKPVVVHGASLLPVIMEGYATGGASPSYTQFAADMKNRTPMLYVGSNDGMLHAFNANTGKEVFSYIPQAVIKNLNKLTSPKYGKKLHQYYVDATPVVSDVIINGSWRTVLVGTLGAGGKGVFALDITEPNNIKLLWDYTDKTLELEYTKLGYTYASPVIAPVHEFYDSWKIDGANITFDTTWGVVLGNGYDPDATHGRGSIIFIDFASSIGKEWVVFYGEEGLANGISGVTTSSYSRRQTRGRVIDKLYAGDYQGNLWYSSAYWAPSINPAYISLSHVRDPIIVARDKNGKRQSITTKPNVMFMANGDHFLTFGTGRYITSSDKVDNSVQSYYGIKPLIGYSSGKFEFEPTPRSRLATREIKEKVVKIDGKNQVVRAIEGENIEFVKVTGYIPPPKTGLMKWSDYFPGKVGWVIDFDKGQNERVVQNGVLFGKTLLFQSMVSSKNICGGSISSWTYAIDPLEGRQTKTNILVDKNSLDIKNFIVSGLKTDGAGGFSLGSTDKADMFELCTGAGCQSIYIDEGTVGRIAWGSNE